jgi:hypothetical protein
LRRQGVVNTHILPIMNKFFLTTSLSILIMCLGKSAFSQGTPRRPDLFYSMSGFGFSVPVGKSSDIFKPKFSTTLGANFGLGSGGLFLYPKLSLHVFNYAELAPESGFDYALQDGRATTYLVNVALGYRKIVDKFAFYGFIGGGGGFILTPQITVNEETNQAKLSNQNHAMGIIEPGLGIEYNIGGANLFFESSFMHGFSKIQNRAFNSVPLTFGIKPNLSKLFK